MKILNRQLFETKEAAALPGMIESGRLPALISGLSAIHRANLGAALFEALERPLFVICPDEASADGLARDLEAMTGIRPVTLYPRDFCLINTVAASRELEQSRINALYSLRSGEAKICVAAVSALMQRTLPPELLESSVITVDSSGEYPPDELERSLLRCGYSPTDKVEGPGQFSRRGGILDFFSPMHRDPVRIEFWGDEIDSMGFFDIGTQRRVEAVEECRILPAAEAIFSLDSGSKEGFCDALESAAARLSTRKVSEQTGLVIKTLRSDAEELRHTSTLEAPDRYLPLMYAPAYGADYIPPDAVILFDQPSRCTDRAKGFIKQLHDDITQQQRRGRVAYGPDMFRMSYEELMKRLADFPVYMADAFTMGSYPLVVRSITSIPAKQLPSYAGSAKTAAEDVSLYLRQGYRVLVLAGDKRRAETLKDFFGDNGIASYFEEEPGKMPEPGACCISVGAMSAGMEYPSIKLAVISDTQLLRVSARTDSRRRKKVDAAAIINSYADLSVGDLVVHETHGIGRFAGIVRMKSDGVEKDYIKICYAGTDVLYVPSTKLDMVSKYLGAGEASSVKLSKLGGTEWVKTRSRAKTSTQRLAKELIALYAERLRRPGHAFPADSVWQREFEDAFGYTETGDQLRCIEEIKADMEKPVPMDRLLCGDVGFGKTEVALRAVMKCILGNRQAAILVPTTVLAQQHYQTALQRFFGYPVRIEVLSRFRTPAQITETLSAIREGTCDLVIGTHRLLQKDVKFKKLGLLVVDEEQRFGVAHKEHIKELSRNVDVLTLSATPIPRTLNMALSGIRDLSTIDEPPQDRLPVQTFVMEHDWGVLCDAMNRELQRGGQVYYLHNRIENIVHTAKTISDLLGEGVNVGVAHGQLDKEELAAVMEDVVAGKVQVLVCTTIIETGIDIPNVNTLIIEDADKLGLAQLHQIRGRVGRSTRRASAYLTFRRDKVLTEVAEKRLTAIREFAEFGSGVRIAMRDLEIRGAGNLLGMQQSGYMIDVGYDMYMKLLNEAVLAERGIPVPKRAECSADLTVNASIPEWYVRKAEERMDLYRRIALIRTEAEADDLLDEIIDRFGEPPKGISALIGVALLRCDAGAAGISDISQRSGTLRFVLTEFDAEKLTRLYAMPIFNGRLKVGSGEKPCVAMKLGKGADPVEEARTFVKYWKTNA